MHAPGYIIIDTEGTGLFTHKYPADYPDAEKAGMTMPSDAPGQPRMAAFAAVLAGPDLSFQEQYSTYIRPEGWLQPDGQTMLEMPQGAFDVHGLTMDFLHTHGVPAAMALAVYVQAIKDGRAVLGFNQQHDGRQVRAELRRAGLDDMFEQTKTVCAMRSMQAAKIKVKKLNGKGGWPRLIDAAAHFEIDYPTDVHHDALHDTLVTRHIGERLHHMGVLLEPAVHYAKDHIGSQEAVS